MHVILRIEFPYEVGLNMLKWVYTDVVEISGKGDNFLLDLLKVATKFHLAPLADRWVILL